MNFLFFTHCGKNHIFLKFLSFGIPQFASDNPRENFLVYALICNIKRICFFCGIILMIFKPLHKLLTLKPPIHEETLLSDSINFRNSILEHKKQTFKCNKNYNCRGPPAFVSRRVGSQSNQKLLHHHQHSKNKLNS